MRVHDHVTGPDALSMVRSGGELVLDLEVPLRPHREGRSAGGPCRRRQPHGRAEVCAPVRAQRGIGRLVVAQVLLAERRELRQIRDARDRGGVDARRRPPVPEEGAVLPAPANCLAESFVLEGPELGDRHQLGAGVPVVVVRRSLGIVHSIDDSTRRGYRSSMAVSRDGALALLPPPALLIGGAWVAESKEPSREHVEPATGVPLGPWLPAGPAEVDAAVSAARDALPGWRSSSPATRRRVLLELAERIEAAAPELGALLALEMGQPVRAATAGAAFAAEWFRYYAGWADKLDGAVVPDGPGCPRLRRPRALRRRRRHRPVERADPLARAEARSRVGGRQHGGRQAVGSEPVRRPRLRAAVRRGRRAGRRRERRAWRRRCGRGAVRAPRRRQDQLHRRRGGSVGRCQGRR